MCFRCTPWFLLRIQNVLLCIVLKIKPRCLKSQFLKRCRLL